MASCANGNWLLCRVNWQSSRSWNKGSSRHSEISRVCTFLANERRMTWMETKMGGSWSPKDWLGPHARATSVLEYFSHKLLQERLEILRTGNQIIGIDKGHTENVFGKKCNIQKDDTMRINGFFLLFTFYPFQLVALVRWLSVPVLTCTVSLFNCGKYLIGFLSRRVEEKP